MQPLQRKQFLKNGLIEFSKSTILDSNVYSVQTDINKGYWIYKGVIFNNNIFNLNACSKVIKSNLSKNTVYYVSTINNQQKALFNL